MNQRRPEANDKNIASSSFAAAASLTSNLVQESNAELAESENYTSKTAKAQAQSLASQKQLQAKKPPTAAKVMTDEKTADAEGSQGRSVDYEQLGEQEALNPEMKGAAANSFSAAARLG
jgi:phosphoribosylanthranilate isomerase